MKVREKFLLIIVVLAGLPLVFAFFAVGHLSRNFLAGQQGTLQEGRAVSMTQSLRFSTYEHIDSFYNWSQSQQLYLSLVEELTAPDRADRVFPGMSIDEVEAVWPDLGPESPDLAYLLSNPIDEEIDRFSLVDHSFVEILITGDEGRIAAASNKSSDFWQADETWWQEGAKTGRESVWVEGVSLDESAGVYSLDVIVPVFYREEDGGSAGAPRKLLAVIKGVVDVTPLMRSVSSLMSQPGHSTIAVQPDGNILFSAQASLPDMVKGGGGLSPEVLAQLDEDAQGWFVSDELSLGKSFVGQSHMRFAGVTEEQVKVRGAVGVILITASDYASAMAPVNYELRILVAVGVVGLLVLLFCSERMLQHVLLRPLNALQSATEQITWLPASTSASKGYYEETLASIRNATDQIKSKDEVQQLAGAFREMANRIVGNEIKLLDQQRGLEKEVAARTVDLEAVNKDLLAKGRELEHAVAELEQKNADLESFAYVVSHDLKAPLRAIGSLTDWLSTDYSDKLDEAGVEMLELMRGRVTRLEDLIDGILEYSRAGVVQDEGMVNTQAIVEEVIASIDVPSHIDVVVRNPLPKLRGTKVGVLQVFQNLISNAIKFNDKPDGLVEVFCERQGEFWEFAVKDNGIGMESKYYERIFKLFQKLQSRDDIEGTGIGLSLVKRRITTAGGTIRLDSEVGRGTVFVFTWPADEI